MANAKLIGRIASTPFETVGRKETWGEQRTTTIEIVGKNGTMQNKVKPGMQLTAINSWLNGQGAFGWFIKSLSHQSEGETATLQLDVVYCPEGKTQPFNITWNVSMEEVQMPLITHPAIRKNADVARLILWEETPKNIRIQKKDEKEKGGKGGKESSGLDKYYFQFYTGNESGTGEPEVKKITDPYEIKYCKAVTAGIETYNLYMPVVVKNSSYLELPGVTYNENHVITGGSVAFSGSKAGSFDEPPLSVSQYKGGLWFKSGDVITTQADGSATRTETWTYAPDDTHRWIYDEMET